MLGPLGPGSYIDNLLFRLWSSLSLSFRETHAGRGAFQQSQLEQQKEETGLFEIFSVPIRQRFFLQLVDPMSMWL